MFMKMFTWRKSWHRDAFLLLILLGLSAAGHTFGKLTKFDQDKRLGLSDLIPPSLEKWQKVSVGNSEDKPEVLDINEFYQAVYEHPHFGRLAITLEYTTDSRRQFELHYPETCHAIRGDRVVPYAPEILHFSDGSSMQFAMMDWQHRNGRHNALAAYWYVTRNGVTTDTMKLKISQALSGILSRPEEAFMVRFDAFYNRPLLAEKRAARMAAIHGFIQHLQQELDSHTKNLLFDKLPGVEI
jgi:hypothetical protein